MTGLRRGLHHSTNTLARLTDVKVRLGLVNSYGQQKGVDSLIVTDMLTLARNRAMAHCVLLSGDEDLRGRRADGPGMRGSGSLGGNQTGSWNSVHISLPGGRCDIRVGVL